MPKSHLHYEAWRQEYNSEGQFCSSRGYTEILQDVRKSDLDSKNVKILPNITKVGNKNTRK